MMNTFWILHLSQILSIIGDITLTLHILWFHECQFNRSLSVVTFAGVEYSWDIFHGEICLPSKIIFYHKVVIHQSEPYAGTISLQHIQRNIAKM